MKKLLLFASMAMLFVSCAVEAQFGQVKESHLSGCNTDTYESTYDAPVRVAGVAPDENLDYCHYVRVKQLTGGDYYFVAQYQVNCCPKSIDAHLYLSDDNELIVNFVEHLGIDVCDCMCPLRCEATLTGMEEGEYPVKIYYNGTLSYQTTVTLAPGVDEMTMLD